jgi:hypothetical protein
MLKVENQEFEVFILLNDKKVRYTNNLIPQQNPWEKLIRQPIMRMRCK